MSVHLASADVFELLHHYGIRTTPRFYASTIEDIVTFARGGRVLLRADDGEGTPIVVEAEGEEQVRRAYERLWPFAAQREPALLLALRDPLEGTHISIHATFGGRGEPLLTLSVGKAAGGDVPERTSQACPVGEDEAIAMIERLRGRQAIVHGTQGKSMLAHLLVRASRLFVGQDLTEMRLAPIVLHGNTYEVVDATMAARHSVEVPRELARRAHDVKGYYKPSGRQ
ncbi:hypothetical protein EPN44_13545 [bacterium]|nr:MAG: hypothetical protein EPN44_13545 [bacterium]